MAPTGILLIILCAAVAQANAAPRTKEHEWMSNDRAVRSETLEKEIRTALEEALEGQQEEDLVLVTDKPVFVKDDDDQVQPEVKPQDENYVVPSYSPVGSENEFGSEDTNNLTSKLILDIEKQLQAEMGQMEGQLSLLHTLISSIFGQQDTLNPKEDFDPNVVVVNVPQQQGGGIGDHNPFTFGFDSFFNDNNDDATDDDDDEAWSSWFQDRPKFPSLSDVFGFPDSKVNNTFGFPEFGDIGLSSNASNFGLPNFFGELPNEWLNLPSNYSNSTHEIQHVNGSVIDVNEAINKQSGDGFNFISHKQVINVHPEDMEILKDSNQENEKEIVADTKEETEEAEELIEEAEEKTEESEELIEEAEEQSEEAEEQIEEIAKEGKDFDNNEIITRNENEIEGGEEEVTLVEKEIGNELSEFPEFKMEAENSIEDEEALIPNWRSQGPEEFSLGETLDEGEFSLGETLDEGEFSLGETLDEGEFSLGETVEKGEFSLGETLDEGEFSLDETLDEGEFSLGETIDEVEFSLGETIDEGEFSLGETLDEGEFSLGETLDEGLSMNHEPLLPPSDQLVLPEAAVFGRRSQDEGLSMIHEPLLLPSDQLVLPDAAVFGRQYENEVHDHELVDFVRDQLSMPEKSAYYDIRSLEHGNKNSVHNYESTYRDLSDDTRVNRISANKSGMRMIEPNAEIFDYKRVLEELKPIQ